MKALEMLLSKTLSNGYVDVLCRIIIFQYLDFSNWDSSMYTKWVVGKGKDKPN